MGNLITCRKLGEKWNLKASNGGMAVLSSVLLLAGSDLACTPWEIDFMRFLAETDQDIFGIGVVGFDLIDDIAWFQREFQQQKDFFLETVDTAIRRHHWELLDYDPPFAKSQLEDLHLLVELIQIDHVPTENEWDLKWPTSVPEKCQKHEIYLHQYGCLICHDV